MASFPSPVTSPQLVALRTSGYWARVLCALNPNEEVFHALSAEAISTEPFITFTYDTVTVGTFGDVWEGMVVYLSSSASLQDAFYRGRVRLAPTSGDFYIDKNASILSIGTHVIVTRDTDLFSRIRDDTLVDGSVTYHALPPMLAGLPMCVVLYDADNNGTEDYTPAQTGITVDAAATTISSWAWDVSGDGTSSIDDPTLEHPTFTFEAGYHYLVRVIYTDDNGTSNYQIMQMYVITRTFAGPCIPSIVTGSISGALDNGWTASLTAYADVSDLLDRTHCAVFYVQHFGDDTDVPLVSNILMNGRIRSSSLETVGSSEAGRVQSVTFTVEGLTAYLRRLKIPNDIVRPTSAPDEWGEITDPTPYRMAVYALWVYSTLTNITSFSVETGEFLDYIIGGEPRGIEGGVALDVLNALIDPTIHAAPNFAPSGEVHLAITTSYRADRSGVDLIVTFGLQDLREYGIDLDSSRTVAQVVAFGGVYDSATEAIVLYTASAPSIIYGDGGEERELNKEILTVDSVSSDATTELGLRASNDYAYNNTKPLLDQTVYDSFAGLLIPANFQRWASVLPASSNTLNKAYSETDYWQLQSVSLNINPDGSIDTEGEWVAETSFDDAQTLSDLLPNNATNGNPILPILPNDPAFPTNPLENYPSTTPGLEDLQSVDPGSAAQAYTPFPPDVASEVANNQGSALCRTLNPNFRSSSNVTSSWTTILNLPYRMTVSGSARMSSGAFNTVYDFGLSDYGLWTGDGTLWPNMNALRDSAGYQSYVGLTGFMGIGILFAPPASFVATEIEVDWTVTGAGSPGNNNFASFGATTIYSVDSTIAIPEPLIYNTTPVTVTAGYVQLIADFGATGSATVRSVTFRGGTGVSRYADAFYSWELDDEGEPTDIQLLTSSQGLYLDNTQYTPVPTAPFPAFNENHRYENLPFTGTGNTLLARMHFTSYTDVQSAYLNIEMCRVQ